MFSNSDGFSKALGEALKQFLSSCFYLYLSSVTLRSVDKSLIRVYSVGLLVSCYTSGLRIMFNVQVLCP